MLLTKNIICFEKEQQVFVHVTDEVEIFDGFNVFGGVIG